MITNEIVSYDLETNSTTSNISDDLLSNLKEFHHNQITPTELIDLQSRKSWTDNSDYSNYPTLREVVWSYNPEVDFNKSFVCRVPMNCVFTSDKSIGGYDRCSEINIQQCISNMDSINPMTGEPSGFDDFKSDTLNAHIRYIDGKLVVVKNKGNHRMFMKLLANYGEESDVLMKVRFHKEGLSNEDYISLEAEPQLADAKDRTGQNENQKFYAGYRAGRQEYIECFNFLKEHELEYKKIMQLEKVKGSKKWVSISNLTGLKGDNNGYFSKIKDYNVKASIGVCKEICEITKEVQIPNSAMEGIAWMFNAITDKTVFKDQKENGKIKNDTNPPYTRKQLRDFLIKVFTFRNNGSGFGWAGKLTLRNLAKKGGMKDVNMICIKAFWPSLVSYHKEQKLSGSMGYRNRYVERYCNLVEQWYKDEALSIAINPERYL